MINKLMSCSVDVGVEIEAGNMHHNGIDKGNDALNKRWQLIQIVLVFFFRYQVF